MWKTLFFLRATMKIYSHGICVGSTVYQQLSKKKKKSRDIHRKVFHIPQRLWRNLQAGVDICSNIPNAVLQIVALLF